MAARVDISVLMPAYNESRGIRANLLAVYRMFKTFKRSFEIVVVDDGSGDWTFEEAKKAARGLKGVTVLRHPVNQGKGWALKEAFRASKGEWLVFLDSDLDIDPKQLDIFFQIQKKTQSDIVIGSKRHPQSKLNYPVRRRIVSAAYFFLVKLLFRLPIRDTQTGLKLFRREVLSKVFPKVLIKRYAFDLELLVLANHYGFKIEEAPVIVNYRGKFGHIKISTIYNIFGDTLAVFYRLYIKKFYDNVGN
jgi:glycosyltransferase involved in cell wall biosynthesis